MFLDTFAAQIKPRPKVRMLDWCRRSVQNENGRPYDHGAYPHLGAPGGPCDAWDDPSVRVIGLQFASRLGKTFFGQCSHLFTAAVSPAPCMFVSASEKIAGEIIARTYGLLERCIELAPQLAREDRRKQDCIELANCRVFVGWARSVTTLADKNVKCGHANEIDKWERATTRLERKDGETTVHGSLEGDPLDLFLDRAKDFPNFKYVLESTPSVAEASRIERVRLSSSNCTLFVPCPHCKHYQKLQNDRIKYEKDENGKSNADIAFKTARYVCCSCNEAIYDHHRAPMMRLGVWVPDGCAIDHAKALETAEKRAKQLSDDTFSSEFAGHYADQPYLIGTPTNDGMTAGYQLSSLYALSLTWGVIAAKWVEAQSNQTSRWNFINQWLGETWKLDKRDKSWEAVGRRIIIGLPQYVAPMWSTFITVGIDRQLDHYKYITVAWGPESRSHILDYGRHEELTWIHDNVVLRPWQHADGDLIQVAKTLVDSGFNPAEPYEYSRGCLANGLIVMCCKGSSAPLGTPFKDSVLGDNTLMPGLPIIMVDPNWTQGALEKRLYQLRPGDPGSLSLFDGKVGDHQDFLKQMINDEPEAKNNARGVSVVVWNRVSDHPNDFRDCYRYADVAHLMWADGGPIPTREAFKYQTTVTPSARLRMEDGRPFLVTERSSYGF